MNIAETTTATAAPPGSLCAFYFFALLSSLVLVSRKCGTFRDIGIFFLHLPTSLTTSWCRPPQASPHYRRFLPITRIQSWLLSPLYPCSGRPGQQAMGAGTITRDQDPPYLTPEQEARSAAGGYKAELVRKRVLEEAFDNLVL